MKKKENKSSLLNGILTFLIATLVLMLVYGVFRELNKTPEIEIEDLEF